MPSDDLDDRMQAWATWARGAAPVINPPEPAVSLVTVLPAESYPELQRRPTGWARRRTYQLASVAAVAAISIGAVAVAGRSSRHRSPVAAATPPALTGTATATSRTQPVTFHGLTIDVPTSWRVVVGGSCTQLPHTVTINSSGDTCGAALPPGDVVTFTDDTTAALPVGLHPTRTTLHINGHAARRSSATLDGHTIIDTSVPDVHASVTITTTTARSAARLAGTLRLVGTDSAGCSTTINRIDPLTAPATGTAANPQGIAPTTATTARVCRYLAGYLERSAVLTGNRLTRLERAFNQASPGLSQADKTRNETTGSVCRTSPTSAGSLSGSAAGDSEYYLITFAIPNAPTQTIRARLGVCGNLGAATGAHTVQRTTDLITALTTTVGNAEGYPTQVKPI